MTKTYAWVKVAMLGALVLATLGCAGPDRAVWASPAAVAERQKEYTAEIDKLLPGMGAAKIEDRKDAQMALEKMCVAAGAPGREVDRIALSKAMLSRAGMETAKPARVWILRKIEPLGRSEAVAGLAALFRDKDPEIRELARRALQNNPCPTAAAALRAELAVCQSDPWRVALINALGARRDAASVPEFIKLAESNMDSVATAAVWALGRVRNDAAIDALARLLKSARPAVRAEVTDACLHCAEELLARGARGRAAKIYEELNAPSQPESVRIAAVLGLAKARGEEAVPTMVRLLDGDDAHMQLVAVESLVAIPGDGVTTRLAATLDGAKPPTQALILDIFARRGCPKALAAVTKSLDAPDPTVRLAALHAMKSVGNASSVPLLARRAATATGDEGAAAYASLAHLKGADVDEAIVTAIPAADAPMRAVLIRAAGDRRITAAAPAITAGIADPHEGVRIAAIAALGATGSPEDLPKLLGVVARAQDEATIKAGESSIAALAMRINEEPRRAAPVVAAMKDATPQAKAAMIRVLGRLQGDEALAAVRAASRSDDKAVKDAAAEALARWPAVYCTTWLFSGPYKQEGKKHTDLFEIEFPPEKTDADVQWTELNPNRKEKSVIELHRRMKDTDCCGYVKAVVIAEKEQEVQLLLGSDDGLKVWINGKVVHANNATRACNCGEDKAQATLAKGENTLLIKVTQGGADWSFCCGFRAPDGGPPEGLKFKAK